MYLVATYALGQDIVTLANGKQQWAQISAEVYSEDSVLDKNNEIKNVIIKVIAEIELVEGSDELECPVLNISSIIPLKDSVISHIKNNNMIENAIDDLECQLKLNTWIY